MAYLKLNSSTLLRRRNSGNDFIILSQVVGSQSSYEIPKKIHTSEELDKWFGDSYPDYSYHRELLNSGASLLLYKPVSLEKRRDIGSYIDYSEFPIDTELYENSNEIPIPEDRRVYKVFTETDTIDYYYIVNGQLTTVPDPKVNYVEDEFIYTDTDMVVIDGTDQKRKLYQYLREDTGEIGYCLWIDDISEYIDVKDLPQNIGVADRSVSWNNRGTLSLSAPDTKGVYVCHPRFSSKDYPEIEITEEESEIIRKTAYDRGGNTGKLTYAVELDFSGVTEFSKGDYICFYVGYDRTRHMIHFGESGTTPSFDFVGEGNRYYINPEDSKENIIGRIWEILLGLKDTAEERRECKVFHRYENTNILWSEYPTPMDYFYRLPGFKLIRDYRLSYDLSSMYGPEPRITFESRTIGLHEIPISITIEKQRSPGMWQVTVRRGGIEEVHVGSLFSSTTKEFLEYVINRDSELVRCRINQYRNNGKERWKKLDPVGVITNPNIIYQDLRYCTTNNQYYLNGEVLPNPDLPEGTWELLGATPEFYGPKEYSRGLDALLESDIKEDFLMIPRISDYRGDSPLTNISWYPEYEIILAYCKEKMCQSVISNNETGEEHWVDSIQEFKDSIRVPQENWIYKVNLPVIQYTTEKCATVDVNTSIGVRQVLTEYSLGDSKAPPLRGWSENIPQPGTGKYIWTKTTVEYYNETVVVTDPELLLSGPEILNILPQYYLSDSDEKTVGDTMWHSELPRWRAGKYLWVRHKITYATGIVYYKWENSGWVEKIVGRDECNPWLNDFIWNYVQTTDSLENPKDLDPDNYLIYFYKTMIGVDGEEKPGYYVFLGSTLTDNHVVRREDILYTSPIVDPIYPEETELQLERDLESKKSNFLVTDGYRYYYKKYMNHTGSGKYNISILSKFYQSKLSRDFDRAKWDIIGQRTEANLLQVVYRILDSFTGSFGLVAYTTLTDYQINRQEGIAYFWVTVRSKELIDKDINLNITLNYVY